MEESDISIGHFKNIFTNWEAEIPNITPMIPPVTLISMASTRNCNNISMPLAPIDILMSVL